MRTKILPARGLLFVTTLVAAGCGGASTPAPVASTAPPVPVATAEPPLSTAPPAPAAPLASDTPRTFAGAAFTAPAGWTMVDDGAKVLLTAPEPDLQAGLVVSRAATADAAVAEAWEKVHPGFKRPVKLATPEPGRDGWDNVTAYYYETSPDEKVMVEAVALHHSDSWTVATIEGGQGTLEKRLSAVRLLRASLRPEGYTKESFAGKTPHELDAARAQALSDFVDHARDIADIPGIAVSVFTTDKVVFERGFGVKELGKKTPVDASTLFMIASNTKALTTLLLAELVDQGKLAWDQPVTAVYPDFKLGDADTTQKVLLRHLVCACTGLPRQDLEWIFQFKGATPATEMQLLGTFQPTTKFGETYQYSNLLAAAAGFVAAHVIDPGKDLGKAYDSAMQSRVFDPLDMKDTTFDYARALRGDHATPHADDVDGHPSIVSMDGNYSIVPLRPAGGAWSNVKDMRRYVQMELAKGMLPNGKRLVSEANLLVRRAPNVPVGAYATYGMGLIVDSKYGVPVVHHGGSMLGFKSDMIWLPDAGVGAVLLTSSDNGQLLLDPFRRKLLEVLFDGRPEADADLAAVAKTLHAAILKDRERLVIPPDAAVVAKLAKHYTSPALGDLNVLTRGSACVFDFGEWKTPVATRKNDDGTVSMISTAPGLDETDFVVSQKDGKRALVVRDGQHEYTFVETS